MHTLLTTYGDRRAEVKLEKQMTAREGCAVNNAATVAEAQKCEDR